MLWTRTFCLNTYKNRTELSNEFHAPILIKLFSLFSEGLFIWYKVSIWEGCLLVCSFWYWCSLHSGSFQQCTSELVNHLLPWMNSTVISSRCKLMFKSIDRILDAMTNQTIQDLCIMIAGRPTHHGYIISSICNPGNGNKTLEQNDSCIVISFILWKKLLFSPSCIAWESNLIWNSSKKSQWKIWKLVSPGLWIASYVARSGHGMLVITLIYLLPFDIGWSHIST